jgi:hypothetical protein
MSKAALIVASTLLVLVASPARAGQPVLTISYSPTLDAACSLVRSGTIKDEWKAELAARQPEFEALWAADGPKKVAATEAVTGKPFPADAVTARLSLCDLPSQSIAGISVNMRYALKSFTATPVPMRYKVNTLFHELLHVYLAKHPVQNSALLAEHAAEPERTRDHLHLLALQKAVLIKLDQPDALKEVVAIDSQLPGGYYRRAWEIVNATDTAYLRYVAELAR